MGSSIRRTDLLALSNLRNDGRKPGEIRRMRVQMGANTNTGDGGGVGGSALVDMGLTSALATVRGPMACARRSDELPDRAMVDVSVKAVPFAPSGGDRRVTNPNTDRRLVEMTHLLKRALEATILLQLYPKSRIQVQVVILADDGGRLSAAINAASVALIDAGIPVKDILCSCSAGYAGSGVNTDEKTLVDLNRQEESSFAGQNAVCLPCAMLPQRGTVVMAQCEARLPDFDTMDRVLGAAMDGCRAVFDIIQAAIRERASILLGMRRGHGTVTNSFEHQNDDMETDG
ncbi:exosome complex exonuclease Rrp41 [Nitzschia inconspicua]|uniref:Exosome complex exonuclease Rrp41 n=1 Tax=Nitzschia inconspicua TaxID=303405 RepID=A0A9K3PNY5_9STRA|nr:exosome complex exonuclease Rrp41 [Nitzschia inconspicua]